MLQVINSYYGTMGHADSYRLRRSIYLNQLGHEVPTPSQVRPGSSHTLARCAGAANEMAPCLVKTPARRWLFLSL